MDIFIVYVIKFHYNTMTGKNLTKKTGERQEELMEQKREDGMKARIEIYKKKISGCTTMTDLLVAMSSWQSFAEGQGISPEQRAEVDHAYLEAETRLISTVKPSLW